MRSSRRSLHVDFVRAIRASNISLSNLAHLAGFAAQPLLSKFLNEKGAVPVTPLNAARLRTLAQAINYDGELFR